MQLLSAPLYRKKKGAGQAVVPPQTPRHLFLRASAQRMIELKTKPGLAATGCMEGKSVVCCWAEDILCVAVFQASPRNRLGGLRAPALAGEGQGVRAKSRCAEVQSAPTLLKEEEKVGVYPVDFPS